MNGLLLGLVGIIYLFVALNYFLNGNNGMGIAFVAYAAANYGLYLAGEVWLI